jgi:FdhE protein
MGDRRSDPPCFFLYDLGMKFKAALSKRTTILHEISQMPAPSAEVVDYYQKLNKFIAVQLDKLRSTSFSKADGVGQRIRHLAQESTLIEMGLVPFDSDQAAENFKTIVGLLLASSPANELAIELHKNIAAGKFDGYSWRGNFSALENKFGQWAEATGIDADSLLQLIQWAMSPFWRLAAEHYTDDLKELVTNERATCPICGKHADFAVLDDKEHGRRYLVCLCCNWQWPFKRTGCGYCGNNDHNQLGYILLDDVKGYSIYCCEKCKSYLKTFDQRTAGAKLDDTPLLENVKTLFMDLLAIEKGYLPMHGQE